MNEGSLLWCFKANDGPKAQNTDKIRSRHAHYYNETFSYLKDKATSILEIGINRGGSIRAWRDFFVNATIHCLDVRHRPVVRVEQEERVAAVRMDVGDIEKLKAWAANKEFDIVVDDGSHHNDHQIIAFEVLWPKVKPGGYFVIEDTFVSWTEQRINPDYPLLETYIAKLFKPVTKNENDILEMTIRPNMIVFRKQRTNEPTVEPKGTKSIDAPTVESTI